MQTNIEQTGHDDTNSLRQQARSDIAQLKERATDGIDQATTSVGRSLERGGDAVDGAARATTDGLKRAGRYMQRSDPGTMAHDFADLARKHPGATLCVGFGLGVLAGRILRPRATP